MLFNNFVFNTDSAELLSPVGWGGGGRMEVVSCQRVLDSGDEVAEMVHSNSE